MTDQQKIDELVWFNHKFYMTVGLNQSIKESIELIGTGLVNIIVGVLLTVFGVIIFLPLFGYEVVRNRKEKK